ncbi:MAG TPA: AMP-binding protein, partial [Candidatus Dormibacteraeota bacterium]|nr:AMP-binding protein [Candidatus Dormibacteraeota bacterium]
MAEHPRDAVSGANPLIFKAAPQTDFSGGFLNQFFELQADASPQRIALSCCGKEMSYGELESRANRVAQWLRNNGVGLGDCVGLLLPRTMEVYVAMLGILKAGAAYVPIDPDYPAERIKFILSDSKAKALVTEGSFAAKATDFKDRRLLLEQEGQWTGLSAERPSLDGLQPQLCYIIYTSGTTGKPKGVEIAHRSASHLVRCEADIFRVRPDDRVFQGASIAFDASVEEIWLAFCAGATLVVGTAEMVHAGPALSRLLTEAGVTVWSTVPTLLSMLEEDVPTLRLLILGGEACPGALVSRWWK